LDRAQANAAAIGAGFLDPFGTFQPYRGTILELREPAGHREWQAVSEDAG